MIRRLATAVVVLSLGASAAPVATTAAYPVVVRKPVSAVAKTCKRGTKATIGGQTKCLQPGEFCARGNQRQYRRYGFTCVAGRLRYS
jgi:phosphate-selective porin